MSLRYKGGVISATPPTTTGGESGSAPGVWTLEQQMQINAAGNWPIQPVPKYIEDVFSTYLYTGNNTNNRSFTNNIDLSGNGGLVWIKSRGPTAGIWHGLFDTARGANKRLVSNNSDAEGSSPAYGYVSAFNADGFTVTGGSSGYDNVNLSNEKYASWTFRKAKKFFDVVTWTGDSTNNRQISHNLGATPGCIIIKIINGNNSWIVWHRSLPTYGGELNSTNEFLSAYYTNLLNGAPTSTTFTVSYNGYNTTNETGYTYVAYLFAHDAGGFGDAGDKSVISCGSYTGPNQTVTLGYEPQWIMYKDTVAAGTSWQIIDNMRGMSLTDSARLFPNSSGAEVTGSQWITPTATGFITGASFAANTFIYIAIRRGPMKTPTTGTSVFAPAFASSSGVFTATSNFPVDWDITGERTTTAKWYSGTRLITSATLQPNSTAAEFSDTWGFDNNTAFTLPNVTGNYSGWINWMFRRAPGFFDVVCYTGTGSARTVSHNLGVAPEMMIVKKRSTAGGWAVYNQTIGNTKALELQGTFANFNASTYWNNTSPTASVFTVGTDAYVNQSSETYVAYLFASVTGVSKVGSYTGTGTTLQVNCGFTGGARFVLIKRTDSTGNWYVWDSARGIVAGNDPYLLLNSTAAEVTNTDYVDTFSSGFEISSTAPAAINANGGTFIFLAIA